jgi:phosphatidylethanolamine-binding protein
MFFPTLVVALTSFASLASAQDTSVGINAIQAHFTQSHLVPDLFATFNPTALLTLDYPGVGVVAPGQLLKKEQVGPTPSVQVTPANSSVTLNGIYTLAMVDADIVGSDASAGETRHWLVNGVTVKDSAVANDTATGITLYAGPWPAAGSGPHRYVVALYSQPETFTAPPAFSQPNIGVAVFDWNQYVKDSGLGPLVAATYITVEEGTATLSIPQTTAVVTSTLAPASTPLSNTGAGTGTSKTGTSSTSTATGTSQTGAASIVQAGFASVAVAGFIASLFA